jgi:hypothetical protein
VHVDATPEEVWDALARFDRLSTWADEVDHSSYLTEQTEGVGAARRVQVGRMVLVERITEWDPPRTLAYDLEGLPPVVGGATNRWALRPDGTGTSVDLTASVDPGHKPPGRLVAPLLARRLARTNEGLLAGLAAHLRKASS